jgi:hypothetical protein
MMEEEEFEKIIFMKLNLLIKIIDKYPTINLEENLVTLLEIYLQNMDRNVKIDNVLILCIKKLMNYFGNNFNEKLNNLNNDGIIIQINEFIKNNIELDLNNQNQDQDKDKDQNQNNEKLIEKEIINSKIILENKNQDNVNDKDNKNINVKKLDFDKIKKLNEEKNVVYENRNNNENNNNKINDFTEQIQITDNIKDNISKKVIEEKEINKHKDKEELIIMDMTSDNKDSKTKKPPNKAIPNKFKKFAKKEENENVNDNNNNLIIKENLNQNISESNFLIDRKKENENEISDDSKIKISKDILNTIDEIKVGKNKKENEKKNNIINIDDININPKNQNKIEENFLDKEEVIDPKKKKEKDLADFERMLEEQMLAESKKMEEKGQGTPDKINQQKKIIKKNDKANNKNINNNKNPEQPKEMQKTEEKDEEIKEKIKVQKTDESKSSSIKNEEKNINTNTNNNTNTNKTISAKNLPISKKTIDIEEEEDLPGNMKSAELENYMNNFIGSEISELLNSEKWNERKDGFVLLYNFLKENIQNNYNSIKNNMQNLVAFLKLKLKNFKETNFNILRESFNIYTELIKNFAQNKIFEKKFANGILKAFWDKMSDSKVKENLTSLLLVIMEYFTPTFVLQFFIKQPEKAKTNPILKEYALLIEKCVDEFGIENLPIKDIVEFCKFMSGNTNPQIRNSSTSLLCVLYKYIGKDMKILLKDIKEATFKLIEVELDKVEIIPSVEKEKKIAKRNIICNEAGENKSATKEKGGSGLSLTDQLFTRVDITKKLTPKLIKELNEGKWGEKKAASEAIEKILLEANNKILHNGINDIFMSVFKARLNDANKNVVRLMIQILTKLIEAMGQNFKQMPNGFFKNITPLLIGNLADKMLLLREDVLICMEKWALNAGIENIISYIPEHLKNENTEMKNDIFKFLGKSKNLIEKNNIAQQNLKEFCGPLLKCLQDKIQQIRTYAEDFICFSLKYVNISNYLTMLKDLKPAIQNDLKKILDNIHILYLEKEKENEPAQNFPIQSNDIINNNENLNRNLIKNFSSSSEITQNEKEKNLNNNIISLVKTNVTNTKNNSESGNENMNLSELKQDSIISSNNKSTINNDDLRTNSQVLSSTNKSNSKRSINSSTNKVNKKPSGAILDKSAEKKRTTIENKTPEPKTEDHYNSKSASTSNFNDGNGNNNKAKTPNPSLKPKNKINGEKEDKVRTFTNDKDENNATNLSSNSMIINNSTNKYESKSGKLKQTKKIISFIFKIILFYLILFS